MCHEKIVLRIKSIVIRTAHNLFRKVHNYTHFKRDLLSFNESAIFWRFFIIFNILNVSVGWKSGKFQSPKSPTGTSISVKESYTTLKSVISSFKICFQNYGQLKRKFLRPKNTSSTFLKFELSSLSGAMLKTRKIPRGGTWVFFGWVCAARYSKLAPRSKKKFP